MQDVHLVFVCVCARIDLNRQGCPGAISFRWLVIVDRLEGQVR
jgi:hypothetical protein